MLLWKLCGMSMVFFAGDGDNFAVTRLLQQVNLGLGFITDLTSSRILRMLVLPLLMMFLWNCLKVCTSNCYIRECVCSKGSYYKIEWTRMAFWYFPFVLANYQCTVWYGVIQRIITVY